MSVHPEKYPDRLEIVPLARPPLATMRVPGSKSITNRALVLAALYSIENSCRLSGVLKSEDTEVMVAALQTLGYAVFPQWTADPPTVTVGPIDAAVSDHPDLPWPPRPSELFVANSGT